MKITKQTNSLIVVDDVEINDENIEGIKSLRDDNIYSVYISNVIDTILESTMYMDDNQRIQMLDCMEKLNVVRNGINKINNHGK